MDAPTGHDLVFVDTVKRHTKSFRPPCVVPAKHLQVTHQDLWATLNSSCMASSKDQPRLSAILSSSFGTLSRDQLVSTDLEFWVTRSSGTPTPFGHSEFFRGTYSRNTPTYRPSAVRNVFTLRTQTSALSKYVTNGNFRGKGFTKTEQQIVNQVMMSN